MNHNRKVVLDTETTGLKVEDGDRIIEIGAVELLHGVRSGRQFHQLVNPVDRAISKDSEEIHGISTKMLRDQPRFEEIVESLMEFITDSNLIMHNAEFDVGFLNNELSLCDYSQRVEDVCEITDTYTMASQMFRGSRVNLNALCNRFGITNVQTREKHNALLDAELLADVYVALVQRSQEDILGDVDVQDSNDDVPTDFRQVIRENIVVIAASTEEQAAHEAYLEEMKREQTVID